MRPLIDMMDASADEAVKKRTDRLAKNKAAPKKGVTKPADDDDDDDTPAPKASSRPRPDATTTPAPPPPEPDARTATIIVPGHKDAKACSALAQTPAGTLGEAQCVVAFTGPRVVTDVHVGQGCANELVVLAGDRRTPRWYVVAPAGLGVAVHGATFLLPADEELVVSARARTVKALRSDAACAITLTGRKP
jgi:hypothetical protein